ncbi:MAG: DNA primase [Candidatus Nanopelagicaceae bacterium]
MALSEETIERIKALSVSQVLEQEGVFLKRVGREFVTHCIWHKDKNPSLTISDEKGFTFCHVCREGGDVINYIKKKYGLNFREACERIANNNNIQVIYKDEDPSIAIEKKKKIDSFLLEAQERFSAYRLFLKESEQAIAFLKQRNIYPETSRFFGLGYDKRENRLVIPIKDFMGRIVGFTKRAIGDEKPKYKNTENNVIFNKSEIVFNEYDAMDHIRSTDQCIFVEGHIDVIAMWQTGIKNVVALQGTSSPSESVIRRMLRRTNSFILCMDADEGGDKAIGLFLNAVKSMALDGKLDVKIASIYNGKDPDEAIKNGSDMQSIIDNSVPWLDWILDKWLLNLDFTNTSKIQEVEKNIKELISRISSSALRAHYYDKAAIRLAQNKQNIAAEILKNLQTDTTSNPGQRIWRKPSKLWTRKLVEKRLLRVYIHRPDYRLVLKPLMFNLIDPDMIWLWNRVNELEQNSSIDCTPHSIMAILAAAEQRYLQKLRPIARPTIKINFDENILMHIEDIMMKPLDPENEGTLT